MVSQEVTKRLPVLKRRTTIPNHTCSVIAALKVFATKWKPCIILYLAEQPLRYNDLYRTIPNISRKMLSEHLKELEMDGLITRKEYDVKKQHVSYSLSTKGKSLLHIMDQLQDWGMNNIEGVLPIKEMIALTMHHH